MVMAVVQLLLFIFRYLEHRGKVDDARRAVEADLIRIAKHIKSRSDGARSDVDHSDDSVLNDPDNRDSQPREDDPADRL